MKSLRTSLLLISSLTLTSVAAAQEAQPQKEAAQAKAQEPAPEKAKAEGKADADSSPQESKAKDTAEPEKEAPAAEESAEATAAAEASGDEAKTEGLEDEDEQAAVAATAATTAETPAEATSAEPEEAAAKKAEPDQEPAKPKEPPPNYNKLPFTHHMKMFEVMLGARVTRTANEGLEPFLDKPVMVEALGRLAGTLFAKKPVALLVVAETGGGSVGSSVRGQESQLTLMHVSAGLELRYHFHHRFYAYGRVMGGGEIVWARIGNEDSVDELSDSNWAFSGDGTLGAAMRFAGSSDGRVNGPRAWLFAEGGFRYSRSHKLKLEPNEDYGPPRADPLELAPLKTTGVTGMAGLGLSF